MPNEETPARRGRSGRRPRPRPRSAARTAPGGPVDVRRRARRRAASRAARRAASPCTILITPATPAAAWVWPMFDLTEPSHSGRSAGPVLAVGGEQRLRLDRVAERGAGAVRLDRVHVGRRRARRWPAPARITRCCDGPFGAVSPFDAPSWLTAEPRTTASTGWPLRRASESRSSSSSPTPSAQPVPSAAAGERLAPAVGGQARAAGRTRRTRPGWPSPSTPPASASVALALRAAPARPGAARPARTSRRCRR